MRTFYQFVLISTLALFASAASAAVEQVQIDSPHPYNNAMNQQWEVKASTGALITAIHFKYIEVEENYDYIKIVNDKGVTIDTITGKHEDYTVNVNSMVAYVQLESDQYVVENGFSIDEIHFLQACLCPMVWAPACGFNGTTYGNSCQAFCDNVEVLYLGECEWREVTETIESSHPYENNQRLAWSLTPPEETPLIKIPFASFDTEQGYDFVRVFGGGVERGKYSGDLDPFEVIVPGPTASIVMNTDGYVVADGFVVKGWSYLVTPQTTSCEAAGGKCVLPKGGCMAPNYIDDSLDCLGFNQVCCMPRAHNPRCDDGTVPSCDMIPPVCEKNEIFAYQDNCYRCVSPLTCKPGPRDTRCDDGTEVFCDMVPPICEDQDILAFVNNCYKCVDPETCKPTPPKAEIDQQCDGPANIECVNGAFCVDFQGEGDDRWGTCHGEECNGPDGVECETGKHCQLYYRHQDSWGWCAQGSQEGGMCGGFAGFRCIENSDLVCDYAQGLVCQDNVADIAGTCTYVPETCPELDEPVCGCDGRTFENDCMRLKHNMGKDHDGPCCFTSGCSGQICGSENVVTTCEYKPEYACYKDEDVAVCGVDENGSCAWLEVTDGSLDQCLAQYGDEVGLGEFCGGIVGIQCGLGLICAYGGDYPDAGGVCEEENTWHSRQVLVETPHPYNHNMDETYSIQVFGAEQIRVHFQYFNMESGYDYVWINEDSNYSWTGERNPFVTPNIDGDTITVRFYSDASVNEYGFGIDRIEYFK